MSLPAPPLRRDALAVYAPALRPDGVERVCLADAVADPCTRSVLEALAAPSYENAPVLLAQEYEKCNVAYLLRDDAGQVSAFFLVGWLELALSGGATQTVFLGLSAAREGDKGRGLARRLYQAFVADAAAWEASTGRRILLWYHTATPVVATAGFRTFAPVEPRLDGSYTTEGAALAREVLQAHGLDRHVDPAHPFVLRGVAKARYSAAESRRIAAVSAPETRALLDQLRIAEPAGDRVFFLARVSAGDDR